MIQLTAHFCRLARLVIASLLLGGTLPVLAALDVGDQAPPFSLEASLAGQTMTFSLTDALKRGPVVLYFFPAAFSIGCTIEAHQFTEAVDEFKSLGASVIGVSADDIETLRRFSATECRNKFAVAADVNKSVMKAYDAVMALQPEFANRVSYLIAPNGTIVYQYTSLIPFRHVGNVMTALKAWRARSQ